MKRKYEAPAIQEHLVAIGSPLLEGSHIGVGEEGNQGDVKGEVSGMFGSKNYNVWDDDWSE